MKEKMYKDPEQLTLPDFIEIKKERERKTSFSIPMKDRQEIYEAYDYARDVLGTPFDTLLTFAVDRNEQSPDKDILVMRKTAHYVRVHFTQKNKPLVMIWTRFNPVDSPIEYCSLLLHTGSEKDFKALDKRISKWKFANIYAQKLGEDSSYLIGRKKVSTLDYMMRACDAWTKHFQPQVYSEQCGLIKGPLTFTSLKLHKHRVRPQKVKLVLAEMERITSSTKDRMMDREHSDGFDKHHS